MVGLTSFNFALALASKFNVQRLLQHRANEKGDWVMPRCEELRVGEKDGVGG